MGRDDIFLYITWIILYITIQTLEGCPKGYFGHTCKQKCGTNCLDEQCALQQDTGHAPCTDGCVDGFWGSTCAYHCKTNCLRCNRTNQNCLECTSGLWGTNCHIGCSQRCVNNTCALNGTCLNGCVEPYFGELCEFARCNNCDVCDNGTGNCLQCRTAFYGRKCLSKCNNCIGACDRITGNCHSGCIPGYYGRRCEQKCPGNCGKAVDSNCVITTSNCSASCSAKCFQNTGICSDGCIPGFSGVRCSLLKSRNCLEVDTSAFTCSKCKKGYFGERCQDLCNCEIMSECGRPCSMGCQSGYHGAQCDKACGKQCFNQTCMQATGVCLYGCQMGYCGETCSWACNVNEEIGKQIRGYTTATNELMISKFPIFISLAMFFTALAVTLMICIGVYFLKRLKTPRQLEDTMEMSNYLSPLHPEAPHVVSREGYREHDYEDLHRYASLGELERYAPLAQPVVERLFYNTY